MCRPSSTLYTEKQIKNLFGSWQCDQPIPSKGKKVFIAFPGKISPEVDLIEVEPAQARGTYGDKMYNAIFSSKEGREFASAVQDAHVRDFLNSEAELKRLANIEKYQQSEAEYQRITCSAMRT